MNMTTASQLIIKLLNRFLSTGGSTQCHLWMLKLERYGVYVDTSILVFHGQTFLRRGLTLQVPTAVAYNC